MPNASDIKTWRLATTITVLMAAFVFFYQRFVSSFFTDVVFEICIFYIPAATVVVIFLYMRRKPPLPSSG